MGKQPNFLFIVLDTLRRDRLGSYGYPRETSPHLDAFTAHATRFDRAVSPAQWTIPSHASMFTGRYPSGHQLTQANQILSGVHPTLAEVLRAGGYHTVALCNNPLVGALDHGLQRGFTEFYNYGSAVPQRPNENTRSALYREFMRHFRPFARRVGNQFAQNDTWFRLALHPFWVPIWTKYINFKGSTAASLMDTLDYWKSYLAGGAQKPLFLFLNLMQPHLPFQPPQDYVDRLYPNLRHDRRAYAYMGRFNARAAEWASPPDPPLQDWQQQVLSQFYDAEIAYQDDLLGNLLKHLSAPGMLDNTVVVITADHGEGLGEHDLFGHGFDVHQELVHVPLILRGADRVPQGGSVSENVSTRRIFHTLLDIAGITPPLAEDDPNAAVGKLSLLNAIGGDDTEGDQAFSEAIPPTTFLNVILHRRPDLIERMRLQWTRRGLYSGDYKLMMAGNTPEALYHVGNDPAEIHNRLAQDSQMADQLASTLHQFVDQFDASPSAQGEVSAEVLEQLRALGYVD